MNLLTTHWIFAFKYWVLARKLELIKQNKNPDANDKLYTFFNYIGIVMNIACGSTFFLQGDKKIWVLDVRQIAQLIIFVSCYLLIDAYCKLNKNK